MKKLIYLFLIIAMITAMTSCGGDIPTAPSNINGNQDNTTSGDNPNLPDDKPNLPDDNPNLPDDKPNLPDDNPNDYYQIYVPYGVEGNGLTNVSYKDTNKLKQLWFDQINRKATGDGGWGSSKPFAIRNKANNRNEFHFYKRHTHGKYSAEDYYYFNENGDIVWKEDNRTIKRFVGAVIVNYKDLVKKEFGGGYNRTAVKKYTWEWRTSGTEKYTVGAIYSMAMSTDKAREIYFGRKKTGGDADFKNGDDPFKDGVYDFIAARHAVETFNNGFKACNNLFERQYQEGFIEILVINPSANEGNLYWAGLHSYYAYHGIYDMSEEYVNHPGIYFNSENMPYMTNQNLYLGKKPEDILTLLNHATSYTDKDRSWCYMLVPSMNVKK